MQRELTRASLFIELEVTDPVFFVERMREWLASDHPVIRRLMSKESPESLATRLIAETKLDDAKYAKTMARRQSGVDASLDPMIALVRAIDDDAPRPQTI